jgi:hypothetical protein
MGTMDLKIRLVKIEIYVPEEFIIPIRDALHQVGAGRIGDYDHVFSITNVSGYWRPLENSLPYNGIKGSIHFGQECKIEVRCPIELAEKSIQTVKLIHPYEEPVINVIPLIEL